MARQQDISPASGDHDRTIFSREFFDLQFSFAERVSALAGIPLARSLFEYTNLYIRFGLGRGFDPGHPGWRAYLDGLQSAEDGREWTYRFYQRDAERSTMPDVVATFGCFSYAIRNENDEKVIRLHFRSSEPHGCSPLGAARDEARRGDLAALFAHLKSEGWDDLIVVGISWLYNLPAYRRLFPPAYVASARTLHGLFRSMPLWGQFLNHRGEVKPVVAGSFLKAIAEGRSLAEMGSCFPLQALRAEAPIRTFYEFYESV